MPLLGAPKGRPNRVIIANRSVVPSACDKRGAPGPSCWPGPWGSSPATPPWAGHSTSGRCVPCGLCGLLWMFPPMVLDSKKREPADLETCVDGYVACLCVICMQFSRVFCNFVIYKETMMVRGYLLDILDKHIYNTAETPPVLGGVYCTNHAHRSLSAPISRRFDNLSYKHKCIVVLASQGFLRFLASTRRSP